MSAPGAGQHDAAAFQQIGVIAHLERGKGILLHQQHRRPGIADAADDRKCPLDDVGRKPERRLVEHHQPSAATSAPGRSPASAARRRTACPPTCLRRSARRGNCVIDPLAVGRDRRRVAAQIGAHLEVLLHRHVREDPPALRAMRDARRQHARRLGTGDILALEAHRPERGAHQARDRAQRRALAGAVGADQGDELPGLDLAARCPRRGDAAVAADQSRISSTRRRPLPEIGLDDRRDRSGSRPAALRR